MIKLPNFLGVGERKCGTTWLSECLRYHPQVFMSSPKELFFFGSRYEEKGIEWYLPFFEGANEYKAVGEFSTSYLQKKIAPEQILESLGKVRIIICVRNPTKRFISEYKQCIRNGYFPKDEFKSLDLEAYHTAIDTNLHILEVGKYSKNIQRYLKAFGDSNVLCIDNKAMYENPSDTLSKTYHFLGVDTTYNPSIIDKRISKGIIPKNLWLDKMRQRAWRWLRRYCPHCIDVLKRLRIPDWYRVTNTDKFEVSSKVVCELNRYYAEEVANLEDLLNLELNWDGF